MASSFHSAQAHLVSCFSTLSLPAYEAGAVPSDATHPYYTYDLTPSPDTQAKLGSAWARYEAVLRVVGQGSSWALKEYVEELEGAFGASTGESYGGVVSTRKIAPFRLPVYYRSGSNVPMQEMGVRVQVRVSPMEVNA